MDTTHTTCRSLFLAQRLSLVDSHDLQLNGSDQVTTNTKNRPFYTGFGHFVELYMPVEFSPFNHNANQFEYDQNNISFKKQTQIDVFSIGKSIVHGIIPIYSGKVLFCYGERECAFIKTISKNINSTLKTGEKLNASQQKQWNFHFSEWISAARAINRDQIVLHFASNHLKIINFNTLTTGQKLSNYDLPDGTLPAKQFEQNLQLENNALVICSFLDGETWESLNLFVGTCLGPINLYQPASKFTQIVRTYIGNNGMPFAIRCYRDSLFSIGDDRSLRVWSLQNGTQLIAKYGHGARPLAMELSITNHLVITAGIDEYCCIWRWTECVSNDDIQIQDLHLVKRLDLCGGEFGPIRAIRTLQPSKNAINLLLSSEHGSLAHVSFFQTNEGCFSDMDYSTYDKLMQSNGNIHSFAFFNTPNFESLLVLLDEKRLLRFYYIDDKHADHRLTLLNNFCDFINDKLFLMDANNKKQLYEFKSNLFAFSTSANILAVCSSSHELLLIKVISSTTIQFVKLQGKFTHLIWVYPEEEHSLLTVLSDGRVDLYSFSPMLDSSDQFAPSKTFATGKQGYASIFQRLFYHHTNQFYLYPDKQKKNQISSARKEGFPHIQCALLIKRSDNNSDILLLGTRSGDILVYSLGDHRKKQTQRLFTLHNAHGTYTVTALCLDNFDAHRSYLEVQSLGRDGTLRKWKTCFGEINEGRPKSTFAMFPTSVYRLHFEWPCAFVHLYPHSQKQLIAGFQSEDFVLMDLETNSIICRKRCGGGNRHWQLTATKIKRKVEENINNAPIDEYAFQFGFAFTKKLLLNYIPLNLTNINLIKSNFHSEKISALAYIVLPLMENPKQSGAFIHERSSKMIILTGSLDRRIVCSSLSNIFSNEAVLDPLCSLQMHRSSIETICLISTEEDNESVFVLSGGGRSELLCYRLTQLESKNIKQSQRIRPNFDFIFSTQLSNDVLNDQDTRLLKICAINLRVLAILCSDGTIRLIHFNPHSCNIFEIARHRIGTLGMFSSMDLAESNITNGDKFLFAISTSGYLHAFHVPVDDGLMGYITELPEQVLVENCGLSAMRAIKITEMYLVSVGSQSGCLSVICSVDECTKLSIRASSNWHASTVTAIQSRAIDNYCTLQNRKILQLLSVALDCQLCIGYFDMDKNELYVQRQISISVSDPAALLLLPNGYIQRNTIKDADEQTIDHFSFTCLISGVGLEMISIRVQEDF